jgi:protease I
MELNGKKVLILAGPDFEDRELFYPLYRLQEAGATVKVAGLGEKIYKGKYGVPIEVDGNTQNFVKENWHAVIIPGGWAPDKIRADQEALEIVSQATKKSNIVAAICHGLWVLASANVLQGKTVTSFVNIKDDLIHAGARWIDQEVVIDGNLITSRKPSDLPAFCREIIKLLAKVKIAA